MPAPWKVVLLIGPDESDSTLMRNTARVMREQLWDTLPDKAKLGKSDRELDALLEENGFLIMFGQDQKGIDQEEIKLKLSQRQLTFETMIGLSGHGEINADGDHEIELIEGIDRTADVLSLIQSQAQDIPLFIDLFSCRCGAAVKHIEPLYYGGIVSAHATEDPVIGSIDDELISKQIDLAIKRFTHHIHKRDVIKDIAATLCFEGIQDLSIGIRNAKKEIGNSTAHFPIVKMSISKKFKSFIELCIQKIKRLSGFAPKIEVAHNSKASEFNDKVILDIPYTQMASLSQFKEYTELSILSLAYTFLEMKAKGSLPTNIEYSLSEADKGRLLAIIEGRDLSEERIDQIVNFDDETLDRCRAEYCDNKMHHKSDDEIKNMILTIGINTSLAGSTFLTDAMRNVRTNVVKWLCSNNAPNLNMRDKSGNTPLALAINKMPYYLDILLKAGADPNLEGTSSKETPLMLAIKTDPSYIPILLKAGADPNLEGGMWKENPLMYAIRVSPSCIPTLIKAGANPDKKCSDGTTPLVYAIKIETKKEALEIIIGTKFIPDGIFEKLQELDKDKIQAIGTKALSSLIEIRDPIKVIEQCKQMRCEDIKPFISSLKKSFVRRTVDLLKRPFNFIR